MPRLPRLVTVGAGFAVALLVPWVADAVVSEVVVAAYAVYYPLLSTMIFAIDKKEETIVYKLIQKKASGVGEYIY